MGPPPSVRAEHPTHVGRTGRAQRTRALSISKRGRPALTAAAAGTAGAFKAIPILHRCTIDTPLCARAPERSRPRGPARRRTASTRPRCHPLLRATSRRACARRRTPAASIARECLHSRRARREPRRTAASASGRTRGCAAEYTHAQLQRRGAEPAPGGRGRAGRTSTDRRSRSSDICSSARRHGAH